VPDLHRIAFPMVLGFAWMAIWAACGATLSIVVGILHPPSIGPGEGPLDLARIVGGAGAGCGVLFGVLLLIVERGRGLGEVPLLRAILWGMLAGVALPLLTPLNDVLVTNMGSLGALAAALCVGAARLGRRVAARTGE